MNSIIKITVAASVWLWAGASAVAADEVVRQSPTLQEVAQRLDLVQLELEQLRRYMGRFEVGAVDLPVSEASLREVYFQAVGMSRKADRLRFECTGIQERGPVTLKGDVECGDVYEVVDQTLQVIRSIKKSYGLKDLTDPPLDSASPEDMDALFTATLATNRQLGLMLERPWAPSDVYRQVTIAIAYTERLIERFPEADSTPFDPPPFEPNKMPKDVIRRLLNCFQIVRRISQQSGQTSIVVGEISDDDLQAATPSDVYDVASLVISELASLHFILSEARSPRESYAVGRKFPADVFQRVGILEQQLIVLEQLVAKHPDWLHSPPRPARE